MFSLGIIILKSIRKSNENDIIGLNRNPDDTFELIEKIKNCKILYEILIILLEDDYKFSRNIKAIKNSIT